MAELLAAGAALGIASSLVTFADVAWRVLKRFEEYRAHSKDVPKIVRHIDAQLPVLVEKMDELKRQIELGLQISPQTPLAKAVLSCNEHIKVLDVLTQKLLPMPNDSRTVRTKKLMSSIYHEKEVAKAWADMESYKSTIMFHFTSMIPPATAELPLRTAPTFMIPFDRDTKFIGRTQIIKDIDLALQSQRRIAIAGIGGIGKTQLAIEYCYRFKETHPDAMVLWVHASSVARFDADYNDIARKLNIPGQDDPKQDVRRLVQDYLSESTTKWLLVVDNADDPDVFFLSTTPQRNLESSNISQWPIARYLPKSPRGSILVTTRNMTLGRELTNGSDPIDTLPMGPQDAQRLLLSRLSKGESNSTADLEKLVAALDCIPLAISQAAAFINNNHISATTYLDLLDSDEGGILSNEYNDWRRDHEAKNSIIRSWKLSFDLLYKHEKRATDILSLMAVLDRQGIPKSLLLEDNELEAGFIIAVGVLQNYSLIIAESGGEIFEMHRLVQISIQKWLDIEQTLAKWQRLALEILRERFRYVNYNTLSVHGMLLPHALKTSDYVLDSSVDKIQHACLLRHMSTYFCFTGQYKAEEATCLQHFEIFTETLGREHPLTLKSMTSLAYTYIELGHFKEAADLQENALAILTQVLGDNHIHTAATMYDLATSYYYLGRTKEAAELQERALLMLRQLRGDEHERTLRSKEMLANTYEDLGRIGEAKSLYETVLAVRLRILGGKHPSTLKLIGNLAINYSNLGQHTQAVQLEEQLLSDKRECFGDQHPSTLLSMSNLACRYSSLGRTDEATELLERTLAAQKQVLGDEHHQTLFTAANLALCYYKLGRFSDASCLGEKALVGLRRAHGNNHPITRLTMKHLACSYRKLDRIQEAIELEKEAEDLKREIEIHKGEESAS
jgi:tetratricopeptide (TPR) repeat protein